VVTVIGWEWQDAQLVSPGTGKVVGTYEQIVESPTGKRIAAYRQLGMDKNGLQIFRNEGGHLVSEYHSDSDRSEGDMSLSKVDSVSWIDDETMLAMLVDRSRATLTFRNGKWELQPGEAK
jgi:hypothetical protein